MDASRIKAIISQCHDLPTLLDLGRHLKARIDLETKADFARRWEAAWDQAKLWPVGSTIYCCCEGTFLGGPWQRGDSGEIVAIQPRAKRIWVRKNGVSHWFGPAGIHRYNLQLTAPEAPLSARERKCADQMGQVLNSLGQ